VRRWLWLTAAAALAVWIGTWLAAPPAEVAPPDEPVREEPVAIAPSPLPPPPPREPAPPPLPRSLAGTRVDGDLALGEDGHFEPDDRTRELFDYFLTAEGEEEPAAIRIRVAAEAAQRLPPDEARRALALFDRYLAYRVALAEALAIVPRGDLHAAFDTVHALRVARFGADDALRLFGSEERLAADSLARLP
jgi:lipase chaperone LimK